MERMIKLKLWTYIGEKVVIDFTDGQRIIGKVTNYDDCFDNESGEDSIHLAVGIYYMILMNLRLKI